MSTTTTFIYKKSFVDERERRPGRERYTAGTVGRVVRDVLYISNNTHAPRLARARHACALHSRETHREVSTEHLLSVQHPGVHGEEAQGRQRDGERHEAIDHGRDGDAGAPRTRLTRAGIRGEQRTGSHVLIVSEVECCGERLLALCAARCFDLLR